MTTIIDIFLAVAGGLCLGAIMGHVIDSNVEARQAAEEETPEEDELQQTTPRKPGCEQPYCYNCKNCPRAKRV